MEEKKRVSKNFIIFILLFCLACAIILIGCFMIFDKNQGEVNENLSGGDVTLLYTGEDNTFSLINAEPIADEEGKKLDGIDKYLNFSVKTTLDEASSIDYELAITKIASDSSIKDEDIRIFLEQQKSGSYVSVLEPSAYKKLDKNTKLGTKKGSMVLVKQTKNKDSIDNYRLRLWLSNKAVSSADAINNYKIAISVTGKAS